MKETLEEKTMKTRSPKTETKGMPRQPRCLHKYKYQLWKMKNPITIYLPPTGSKAHCLKTGFLRDTFTQEATYNIRFKHLFNLFGEAFIQTYHNLQKNGRI